MSRKPRSLGRGALLDGIQRIVCIIDQAGTERHHRPSIVYLKKGMEKESNGERMKPLSVNIQEELDRRIGMINVDFNLKD